MPGDVVREASHTCAIAVMAKASIEGRTKTRLTPPLTAAEAADLNTSFLRDVADNLLGASALANVSGVMAYAPAGSAKFFENIMPQGVDLLETAKADFGDCLFHAAASLLESGHGAVCLLNSDSPTLPIAYLTTAVTILAAPGDRVVIGPSTDGGYYLLGLKRPHRRLFEDVEWSTERVFDQTLARAAELGIPVSFLPTWYDVDDADALRLLVGELFHNIPFRTCGNQPTQAAWTKKQLARLLAGDLAARLQGMNFSSLVA